jgi:hypothetical protein
MGEGAFIASGIAKTCSNNRVPDGTEFVLRPREVVAI